MNLHNTPQSACSSDESGYRVEVSGWDASENFFVEKTTLNWCDDAGKQVLLHSSLREGAIVFIRLNQSATEQIFPIAYRAQKIGPRDARGLSRVSLVQLRPRPAPRVGEPLPEGKSANGAPRFGADPVTVESCEEA